MLACLLAPAALLGNVWQALLWQAPGWPRTPSNMHVAHTACSSLLLILYGWCVGMQCAEHMSKYGVQTTLVSTQARRLGRQTS